MVRSTASDDGPLAHLSQRERQMAELIATGADTRAIADRLAISAHTVRRHTERVFRKLGVRSRLQVALVVHQGATVRE
jgi:DNA-binding CsgD family transcriptional regulator